MDPALVFVVVLLSPLLLGVVYGLVLKAGYDPAGIMAPEDYDEPR